MKVILLKNIQKIGKKDEVVEVKDGYAQNALFPKKLAIPATKEALQKIEEGQQSKQSKKELRHKKLADTMKALNFEITITAPANEKGILFSKIDEKTISQSLKEKTLLDIEPKALYLEKGHIKKTGEYAIEINENGYKEKIKLIVLSH